MYQVVIVEDDPMVSLLDRTFTEKDPRFQVVQTFSDGQSALAWLCHNPVDLLILDVSDAVAAGHQINHSDLENLQKQVVQLNRQWNCPESLEHFPKLLIPASDLNT